ncbi:putative orfan [Tupanvirus soda lake]|uniref:Orfan n=2 Tax=Tupanvirus TaxID=2094720 RepID=A0AC62AAN4_9VIRU|nr:putative orfan [Tupanvirus soda lake]QKU34799.1 putative orfan [Tupanvirus soda lake]
MAQADPMQNIPIDSIVTLPKNSFLYRVGTETKGTERFRWFSYWWTPGTNANLVDMWPKNILAYESKLNKPGAGSELFYTTDDINLIKIPYNSSSGNRMSSVEKNLRDSLENNYFPLATADYHDCYRHSLYEIFGETDNNYKYDAKKCISEGMKEYGKEWLSNPDLHLADLFYKSGLNGWIRLFDNNKNHEMDEILLTNKILNKIKLITRLNKSDINTIPDYIKNNPLQPSIYLVGGNDKYFLKYIKYKAKYLKLLASSQSDINNVSISDTTFE